MDLRNMSPRQQVKQLGIEATIWYFNFSWSFFYIDEFFQVFHELVLTEANYTKIIRTMLEVFKKPLEDPDIIGGELLNQVLVILSHLYPLYWWAPVNRSDNANELRQK